MILDDFCNSRRYEPLCGGFGAAFDFIRRCRDDLPPEGRTISRVREPGRSFRRKS